ncbi:winged helix-turn-helix domain-containing protein [Lactobacillus sp. Sy-1]|uniref:winged helix-turn-helix domain-containing protein n=1 Tax=Lactobacillus sp. Sy-1 TaxID=2109645 RepID=UPI001C58882C|nr:winged helix-turn-helix domain-containing protein [Lactobacillus sp. Sy-1]MBW1605377.1 winged helix-turn-helix domain-containing protein [Lactobacillus sp. Sy-1]
MNTILLVTNHLKLAMKINAAGNNRGFFINNFTNISDIDSYLSSSKIVGIVWDLEVTKTFKDSLKELKSVRENFHGPIITIEKKHHSEHEQAIFEAHLDDYIIDPNDGLGIILRIEQRNWVYNQVNSDSDDTKVNKHDSLMKYKNFTVDLKHFQVKYNDDNMKLTPKEFYLMNYLIRHSGMVLSREKIYNGVWGSEQDEFSYISSRIVDMHVSHLRDKLKTLANDEAKIKTIRGFGYQFE